MNIKREDLDAGRIHLADVTAGKRLPLIHLGEILRDDFLLPMKISASTLAQAIKVPRSRVNDIVLGRCGITLILHFVWRAISALRRIFGSTCTRVTIWTRRNESFAATSSGRQAAGCLRAG